MKVYKSGVKLDILNLKLYNFKTYIFERAKQVFGNN